MSFDQLLEDNEVTEIIINGYNSIFAEKNGSLFKTELAFEDEHAFQQFIQSTLEDSHTKLDLEAPFVCFLWKSFRVHLSHPPLSKGSHLISMRRIHRECKFKLNDFVDSASMTLEQMEVLKNGVQQRKNILVVGGTGSGKTTTLSALLKELDENSRVLVLEDTDEIDPPNELSAKLLTRDKTPALREFDLGDLLRESLRMRPDRLVVGEVRGGEAKDLLLSLSTGHHGSMATLHASSAQEALLRLEMLVQIGAPHWNIDSIRKLISLTIHWIVVVERFESIRRIEGVYEITSLESVGFLTQKIA